MAVRPAWKGYIKLSLVTCAVELFNATTATEKVSFRILNRATGNTVQPPICRCRDRQAGRRRRRGQGLRGQRRQLPADRRGRDRGGPDRVQPHAQPRRLRPEIRDRPDLSRHALLSRARRRGIGRGVRGDPRRAGRQEDGRHGAHRALPPRAAGRHRAARPRHAADHAALRQAGAQAATRSSARSTRSRPTTR